MIKEYLEKVRSKMPLIHNITNYVTVNDCANILLACGASPIMADDIAEAEEITAICGGLNINIGTLNQNTIPAMFAAGKKSGRMRAPGFVGSGRCRCFFASYTDGCQIAERDSFYSDTRQYI